MRSLVGVLLAALVTVAAPASADVVTWTSTQVGLLPSSITETVNGHTLTLDGFQSGLLSALFGKQNDPSDHGLGLFLGPSNEIGFGAIGFGESIEAFLPGDVTCPCTLKIESLDPGESFQVTDILGTVLASGTGGGIQVTAPLAEPVGGIFVVEAANVTSSVLLDEITAQAVVPEPATLTLLGTGLVGLGAALRRRRAR